jgi:SAM-dependent methyltransferase
VKSADELKDIVKSKYGEIARQGGSCCGPTGCGDTLGGACFAQDYQGLDGYFPDADLGLGCGIPTEYAGIEAGQTVVDLGSGAGNDVFVVRAIVGAKGRAIGLDMVPDMVAKAKRNAAQLNYDNVEFHLGEIEDMPLADGIADVVVSNCVLNLVPDKKRAFAEIHRVLKPGGHFCVSDIVLEGDLPAALGDAAIAYAGCVAGAQQKQEYLATIAAAGFSDATIRATRRVDLPDQLMSDVLGAGNGAELAASGFGIYSITVVGHKEPGAS